MNAVFESDDDDVPRDEEITGASIRRENSSLGGFIAPGA